MVDEIHPYLVYRVRGAQLECALWQLREGPAALALFLSGEAAEAYRCAAHLGADWRVFRPAKEDLWQLLKEYHRAGVLYAVLDPDHAAAKRVFDIQAILGAVAGAAYQETPAAVRELYHLAPKATWEQAPPGPYRAASLAAEGFIHCSYREQLEQVANLFYAAEPELLLLCIDPGRLTSPVRDEDPGTGELFPHVYGPIDRPAIRAVHPMRRDDAGRWVMPE